MNKNYFLYSNPDCMHCDHEWMQVKVGSGYHKFCKKCGEIRISSGVLPKVSECEDFHTHNWRATSYVCQEGCAGAICTVCGKIGCGCDAEEAGIPHDTFFDKVPDGKDHYKLVGDLYFEKFYPDKAGVNQ
jgi:hypothetical protein